MGIRKKTISSIADFERKFFPKDYIRKREEDRIDKMRGIKRCPHCRQIIKIGYAITN